MADIKHPHAAGSTGPTEGDGISYRGIVWFVGILVVTTLVCQGLMWWLFQIERERTKAADTPRAPYAAPALTPPGPPNLIALESEEDKNGQPRMPLGEPTNLQRFRESEDAILTSYGWIDRNGANGAIVRIPIERAKALLLERGLPTRAAK
jgi:hypothetical protein